jgi:hypothetical protein
MTDDIVEPASGSGADSGAGAPLAAYPSPAEIRRAGAHAPTVPGPPRFQAAAPRAAPVGLPEPPTPSAASDVTLDSKLTAARPKVSGLAVASLVLGVLWIFWIGSMLAVVFGHSAMHEIRRADPGRRASGTGLALTGVILGWVGLAWLVVFVLLWVNT